MHKILLKDRILYPDGDSVISADNILKMASAGKNIDGMCVNILTDEIKQFNKLVAKDSQIRIKSETIPNDLSWVIPQEYAELDIEDYIFDTFIATEERMGYTPPRERKNVRLAKELMLYSNMGLYPILRVLIYIINTLRKENIVWGIGRGSSVSSYVLYIIGVHDVDSEEYDLDIHDFLRI